MLKSRRNKIVRALLDLGYTLNDFLPAYSNSTLEYLDEMLADNAYGQSRPVIAYGLLSVYPCKSKYFNITEHLFRSIGREQPWPPDPNKISIFFFGGPATLGINIEDKHTIPARLQSIVEKLSPCDVYNFGCGSHTLRHEILRFLDLIDQGRIPDCAVFLDGYNDSYETLTNCLLINLLDSFFQREKRRWKKWSGFKAFLDHTVFSLIERKRFQFTDRWEKCPLDIIRQNKEKYLSDGVIAAALENSDCKIDIDIEEIDDFHQNIAQFVWGRYLDSVTIAQSLAARNNIKLLFAWQPVPLYKTASEQRIMEKLYYFYRYGTLTQPVYNWLSNRNFPGMEDDLTFIDISMLAENMKEICYVDTAHYSPAFCKVIAEHIAQKMVEIGMVR